ncbi:hypothetical protein Tco_0226168 [Tanacetum coccineum]
MLDKKELTLTLDEFRQIFHLPRATANNHNYFRATTHFLTGSIYYKTSIGFTMGVKDTIEFQDYWSSATMANVMQNILQVLNNTCHWMGPTAVADNTNVILLYSDRRHVFTNSQDDDIMKNIFNSGRHKNKVGIKIPDWMLTDEMKQSEHYRMYTEEIYTSYTPAPVPTINKADEMILQDTLQVSLAEHKIRKEQEARENVALVAEHLASEEIEKMVDEQENIVDDSSIPRNDESNIPGTRIEPRMNVTDEDEEITDEVYELKRREKGKNVEETRNSPIPTPIRSSRIHTNLVSSDTKKLKELTDNPHTKSSSSSPHKKLAKTNRLLSLFKTKPTRFKLYKRFFHELQGCYGYLFAHLWARFMPRNSFDTLADNLHDVMVESLPKIVDKQVKKQVMQQVPEQERGNIQAQISAQQIENAIANVIPSQVDVSVQNYMSGHILHVHPAQSHTSSVPEQQYQLYLAMKVDPQLQQQDIAIWLALQMKFERNTVLQTACRTLAVCPRYQDDPHDDAHPEGENSAKRQKTSEYEAYVSRESSSGQAFQEGQASSTLGNQEQDDDFDFWTDSYATDDDEIPTNQIADEMLRQRCTSGDEHHCQKDPEALALSLINQDLLYLKKGNSGPEKIVLSLHKFPAIIFNDDDIEERTSRWVNKSVKKFNPYARYGVEHWKNPHAKIFYIRKQKEPGKPKEEIYSNSKIPDYKNLNKNDIEDIYLLIMNGKIPDYVDTRLLWSLSVFIRSSVIWERVHDFQLGIESYQQKVNLTAPTITFSGIEEHDMFSIIYEPVHGIIYKNSKKEKWVMRHTKIHKFCDAALNRVLEGLKSYNNDVKYGYVQKDLTKDETEYLKLFEEEIEERLKHRRQVRRCEMYVNGRPLGLRREHPE